MRSFARRRIANAAVTLAALGAVWWWAERLENSLRTSRFFTGWLLLATIVFLAAFQVRKKLPAPALGSASAWLQAHIYAGLATAGLFALHAGLQWPTGILESLLTGLYATTFASGILGFYWTRTLPRG